MCQSCHHYSTVNNSYNTPLWDTPLVPLAARSQLLNVLLIKTSFFCSPSITEITPKLHTFKCNVLQLGVDGNNILSSRVEKNWSQQTCPSTMAPCLWHQSCKICGRGEDTQVSTHPGKFVCYQVFRTYVKLLLLTFKEQWSVTTG